jgi:hypothetical protein
MEQPCAPDFGQENEIILGRVADPWEERAA